MFGVDADGAGLGSDRDVCRARLAPVPLDPLDAGVRRRDDPLEKVFLVVGADHDLGLLQEAGELGTHLADVAAGVDAEETAAGQCSVEVGGGKQAEHQNVAGVLVADGDGPPSGENVLEFEGPVGGVWKTDVGGQQGADPKGTICAVVGKCPARLGQEEVLQELGHALGIDGGQRVHALRVPDLAGPIRVDVGDAGVDPGKPVPPGGADEQELVHTQLESLGDLL